MILKTIVVTHGSDFQNGDYDKIGRSQSVCVKPGEELTVLRLLGDQLRGVTRDGADSTIVTSISQLTAIVKLVTDKYSLHQQDVLSFALNDLVGLLKGGINSLYSEAERSSLGSL